MLDVFGLFSVETLYVLIGIIALLVIAIVLSIVAIAKSSSMKKKYNKMMEGSDGKSIEQIIKEYTDDVKLLKSTYEDNTAAIKDIYENMEFNVYIKNHKMHIESKQKNKMICFNMTTRILGLTF